MKTKGNRVIMQFTIPVMMCIFFNACTALAEDMQQTTSSEIREPSPTQKWLELQRSGTAASPNAQPLSGEVMDKVHRRYLKSFEHPIPEFYDHAMPIKR